MSRAYTAENIRLQRTVAERQGARMADAKALTERLEKMGILALYGGGANSKGHGFWLNATTEAEAAKYQKMRGFWDVPGVSLRNNGKRSGNAHFWMYEDALALVERMEAAEAPGEYLVYVDSFEGAFHYFCGRNVKDRGCQNPNCVCKYEGIRLATPEETAAYWESQRQAYEQAAYEAAHDL